LASLSIITHVNLVRRCLLQLHLHLTFIQLKLLALTQSSPTGLLRMRWLQLLNVWLTMFGLICLLWLYWWCWCLFMDLFYLGYETSICSLLLHVPLLKILCHILDLIQLLLDELLVLAHLFFLLWLLLLFLFLLLFFGFRLARETL
jgi:hypothetical protein